MARLRFRPNLIHPVPSEFSFVSRALSIISGFFLQPDLLEQFTRALLFGIVVGEDLEGRRVEAGVGRAAGVAHDGSQVLELAKRCAGVPSSI